MEVFWEEEGRRGEGLLLFFGRWREREVFLLFFLGLGGFRGFRGFSFCFELFWRFFGRERGGEATVSCFFFGEGGRGRFFFVFEVFF